MTTTTHFHGSEATPCHLADHRFIDERCVPLNCRQGDHTPRPSAIADATERHYTAKQALREGLDQGDPPDVIDKLWTAYEDALDDLAEDGTHRAALAVDAEYDDLEAAAIDAGVGTLP